MLFPLKMMNADNAKEIREIRIERRKKERANDELTHIEYMIVVVVVIQLLFRRVSIMTLAIETQVGDPISAIFI